jgi:hypothetical protein
VAGAATARHAGWLTAVVGTLVLSAELSDLALPDGRRLVLSVDRYRAIPDCPAGAAHDVTGPDALQCWFYDATDAWRIVGVLSAHNAVVIEVEVTDIDRLAVIAETIVTNLGSRFGEVLVYGTQASRRGADGRGDDLVTRIRWTPQEGFSRLRYARPPSGRARS